MRNIELLCPAGDLTRLICAVDFGADAVYLAGEEFGMRTASANFSLEDMKKGIEYAHSKGVKVHITCNTTPHCDEIERIPEYIRQVSELNPDAFIVGDLGTLAIVKENAPNVEIHASVQSGITNYMTAIELYKLGARRAVLARELTVEEIRKIREKIPEDMELECFVHGAMCVSYSGRCLLSSYMTGRDANRGDCAQPCRWSYSLMEQTRPGEYYDITQTDKGTYILNANDLNMSEHLADLYNAGVNSFKIEGRAKSHYYVAVVTNAYRGAVDNVLRDVNSPCPEWVKEELEKISHRTYSTGFYYDRHPNTLTYATAGYIRDYAVAAVVEGYENGCIIASLKNKFFAGTTLDCLEAGSVPFKVSTDTLYDEKNEPIDMANKPTMLIKIPFDREVKTGSFLRMKSE
ncbi:MAG: U32 family peptidase [Acutalibacteraceae bacterium]|nr:U32 family peptidase [Acutalibacteraceae bacterium]